jgi:hypothetical protein
MPSPVQSNIGMGLVKKVANERMLERFDFSRKNQNRPKLLLSINFAEF